MTNALVLKLCLIVPVSCIHRPIMYVLLQASHVGCLNGLDWCHQAEFWARNIVNIGVSINPIVYGVMKRTYRRGYHYLIHMTLYICTFTLIAKPAGECTMNRHCNYCCPCKRLLMQAIIPTVVNFVVGVNIRHTV